MNICQIRRSSLKGKIALPSSKSHTIRSLLFASLAKGTSTIFNPLPSPDTEAMIRAIQLLGASVYDEAGRLRIEGIGGIPRKADDVIDCGNSGQVLRFVGAFSGLIPHYTILTGDASIRSRRPVQPLLSALQQLGALAESSRGDGFAPIIIRGPFAKQRAMLDGQDSQPVSGLLMASAFAPHPIQLTVTNPGETPWIDLTLSWLDRLNIPYAKQGYTFYELQGGASITGFSYAVPGDLSTAAFPIGAALITGSDVTLENVDLSDVQGDKVIVSILENMGAKFQYVPDQRLLHVLGTKSSLQGGCIDVNACIDALPILAVIGCFASSPVTVFNGAIARKKESDRISAICQELRKMGAQIDEKEDGFTVWPSSLTGAHVDAHADHRIALALSVAALNADGVSHVHGIECMNKTYPSFFRDFQTLGAEIGPDIIDTTSILSAPTKCSI